jgi:Helix-turn-helix domain
MTNDILTKQELADILKISKRAVDTLCETRTRVKQKHPVPVFKINGAVRFSRQAITDWLQRLQEEAR